MVHAVDSKSTGGNTLGVRIPPPAPEKDCRESKFYQQTGQTARSAFCYIKGIIEQEMVRLRKNNKAGNPHKHYIFCRTSLFRLRSYKDNFHTKTIKQAIF